MKKILTIGEILVEIVASSKGDGFLEAQPLTGPYPSRAPTSRASLVTAPTITP